MKVLQLQKAVKDVDEVVKTSFRVGTGKRYLITSL